VEVELPIATRNGRRGKVGRPKKDVRDYEADTMSKIDVLRRQLDNPSLNVKDRTKINNHISALKSRIGVKLQLHDYQDKLNTLKERSAQLGDMLHDFMEAKNCRPEFTEKL
jgi:hypothetical protein